MIATGAISNLPSFIAAVGTAHVIEIRSDAAGGEILIKHPSIRAPRSTDNDWALAAGKNNMPNHAHGIAWLDLYILVLCEKRLSHEMSSTGQQVLKFQGKLASSLLGPSSDVAPGPSHRRPLHTTPTRDRPRLRRHASQETGSEGSKHRCLGMDLQVSAFPVTTLGSQAGPELTAQNFRQVLTDQMAVEITRNHSTPRGQPDPGFDIFVYGKRGTEKVLGRRQWFAPKGLWAMTTIMMAMMVMVMVAAAVAVAAWDFFGETEKYPWH